MSVLCLKIVSQPSGEIVEIDELTDTGAQSLLLECEDLLNKLTNIARGRDKDD